MAKDAAREVLKMSASALYSAWCVVDEIRSCGLPENYDEYHEQIENLVLTAAGFLGYAIQWCDDELTDAQLLSLLGDKEGFATFAFMVGKHGFEQLSESGLDGHQGGSSQGVQEAGNS